MGDGEGEGGCGNGSVMDSDPLSETPDFPLLNCKANPGTDVFSTILPFENAGYLTLQRCSHLDQFLCHCPYDKAPCGHLSDHADLDISPVLITMLRGVEISGPPRILFVASESGRRLPISDQLTEGLDFGSAGLRFAAFGLDLGGVAVTRTASRFIFASREASTVTCSSG